MYLARGPAAGGGAPADRAGPSGRPDPRGRVLLIATGPSTMVRPGPSAVARPRSLTDKKDVVGV